MSRFVLGNCIDVMARIPDNAIDFILTDPPYLVGFRDRSGRTIAGDKTDEWLQPACNEMYRVLKKDALMVSFYGWNRVDRFVAAWKNAGFSVVGHLVFTKNYTSKAAYVGYRHECAYILAKGRPRLPQNPLPDVLGWKYSGNRHHPTEKPVNLDEVHEGLLLQAVRASWLAKENRARIDDVVDFLKNASDSEQYAGSPTIRSRLDEMIVLLDQYTANGTYGQYFNSDEPSLRDDAKMVVLELGGLEDRPSLLVAVMFSLIIYIENRMYRTPRNLKKLNVIDEGWRLLDFKNRKVGEFIEKGYRTARRHTGAYITITQNIVDFDSDKASSAARAAWGNSSYKIILKQSAKEFAKYNQLYPGFRNPELLSARHGRGR